MLIPLSDILDVENLALMVKEGYIDRKESSDGRVLYNYSAKAQFAQVWNHETRMCRGLVTDDKGNLLARPFPKFWNLAEHANPNLPQIPDEPFEVQDKLDGSLIIAYLHKGDIAVNTRGSFRSDQAFAAKVWLWTEDIPAGWFPGRNQTWLFEWIHPSNKLVVDYGTRRECVLLDVIDNATGESLGVGDLFSFTRPDIIPSSDYNDLPDRDDAEGYVVKFVSGFRVKVKHPRYVRLHKILSGLTEHRIWEILSSGGTLDEILAIVPDEIYAWIDRVVTDLFVTIVDHKRNAQTVFEAVAAHVGIDDRKAFALDVRARQTPYEAILFRMLDHKPIEQPLWRLVEPKASTKEVEK